MILPPSILRLRIRSATRGIGLWLPLILLWPIVAVLAVLVSPVVLLAAILLWPRGLSRPVLMIGPALYRLACGLRGLEVQVDDKDSHVLVKFM